MDGRRPQSDTAWDSGHQLAPVAALGVGHPLVGVAPGALELGLEPADLRLQLEHPLHAGQVEARRR